MKKFAIFILGLVMAATLCACSCTNMDPANTNPSTTPTTVPTTAPTTAPTTTPSVMPTDEVTVPVPETNVPDPSVDDNSGNSQSRNRMRNGLRGNMIH